MPLGSPPSGYFRPILALRRSRRGLPAGAAAAALGWLAAAAAIAASGKGIHLTLTLNDGTAVAGTVREHDDDGVVLAGTGGLAAIPWKDVSTSSAYQAKKQILASIRGSEDNLTAEDHFQLGYFLAVRNRHAAAGGEFRKAEQRDPAMGERIRRAWFDIRQAKERDRPAPDPAFLGGSAEGAALPPASPIGRVTDKRSQQFTEDQHRTAVQAYREAGERIRDTLDSDLVLLETRHFLIWTDWTEHTRNLVPDWTEQMYSVLCGEFGFPKDEPIWLGKCPVYCFRSKARFAEFAKTVDEQEAGEILGYTRTVGNGYAHVVLRRLGDSPADIDRFATTMVHEACHAFMHNYCSTRELPPWLSEGLADYVAERVLQERCRTGEAAAAIARQIVQDNQSIHELFEFTTSPPGHYYPIACSVVDFLIRKDHPAFVRMVDDIKAGLTGEQALARHFKGWDYRALEQEWRSATPH